MNPAILCRDLRKVYEDGTVAVDGLDLDVSSGECFGLLGPNGAGKTTTVEILEGLLDPSSGDVQILGSTWKADEPALRQRLGISLQQTHLPDRLRVAELVRLFRSFYDKGREPEQVLKLVSLEDKRDALYDKLSGGQKQRLAVACALVGDPDILFLDEPTTGLDPQSRLQLWDIVREFLAGGRTVLLTTHYMEEAERLCKRVAIVDKGKIIAQGTPGELVASLGGSEVIDLSCEGALRQTDRLSALRGVQGVRHVGGDLAITVDRAHETLPVLFAFLAEAGLQAERIATRRATLEDVFVTLTGRHLRD